MTYGINLSLLLLIVLTVGCNVEQRPEEVNAPGISVFPKGEILSSENFSGAVWLGPVTNEEYAEIR